MGRDHARALRCHEHGALALRFHAQTGGSTLTAQQPENNIVRAHAGAGGGSGARSRSTPTPSTRRSRFRRVRSAAISLRTQQIVRRRNGVPNTIDPVGGSYAIESMTSAIEQQAREIMDAIARKGGAVKAIEEGFVQQQIAESAYRHQTEVESAERVVVGVNAFAEDTGGEVELLQVDPAIERRQCERTVRVRAERDGDAAARSLAEIRDAAETDRDLLPPMREALHARCTVGEICGVLRELWGTPRATCVTAPGSRWQPRLSPRSRRRSQRSRSPAETPRERAPPQRRVSRRTSRRWSPRSAPAAIDHEASLRSRSLRRGSILVQLSRHRGSRAGEPHAPVASGEALA